MKILLLIIFITFSFNAVAEEVDLLKQNEDFCKYIIDYQMPDDVAYKDENSNTIEIPNEIVFPLNIDAAKTLGINIPTNLAMEGNIGEIKIDKNGKVYFNNKLIEDLSKAKLQEACDNSLKDKNSLSK